MEFIIHNSYATLGVAFYIQAVFRGAFNIVAARLSYVEKLY